jgi:DNA-binding NarL/FixJ family response regulator
MHSTNSIAVLDDQFLITEAIEKIVSANPQYTFYGGFSTGSQLIQHIHEHGVPAFLLLDINLLQEDGIVLCKKLSHEHAQLSIVMLSGLTQPAIIRNALKSGARGFMPKNMNQEDLWTCLNAVEKGEIYLHRDIEKILMQTGFDQNNYANSYIPKLSRREKEVLNLIVREMTTQEIANTLFISINTVETHRSSLLTKLGARNTAGLVKTAIEKGLLDD